MFQMSDVQSDYSEEEYSFVECIYVEYSDDEGVIPVDPENDEEEEKESEEFDTAAEVFHFEVSEEESEDDDRPSCWPKDIKPWEEEEEDKSEELNPN